MNVKQMHINVNLGAQKSASNQYDNFEQEEVDIALNISQDRVINQFSLFFDNI